MYMPLVDASRNTYMPAGNRKIALCNASVLLAGFITMFVLGILGTQGIVSMVSGGAYAMIALGTVGILGLMSACCGDAKKARYATVQ